jgi:flavodoxin
MSKTLVVYFSASGTTARVAKDLAEAIDADLYEIKPETPYTRADLNWQDKGSRTTKEMNDESCRPAIAGVVEQMKTYDTVFVGFPVWWYVEPRIIDTFLEAYDFSGKTVIPFATSGGSGLGKAPQRMQTLAPGAHVVAGGTLNGRPSKAQLASWAEGALR